ncbi:MULTISPECIES: thiamine pyrophosphate-dependent enzyme [unclassified Sphingomonas]|uniref:thiamine pyrophosphate-dependent enzyme n=1 Tax=unclassified Sphingomonas TaxID=196159 RepID=UPI0006FE1477|nr:MULTISPECIES: thiamine pyrophosphate-dependent enzyme [unclassified Sphingomonas]KQX19141.1 2-oxoisovalerate dehydrogenase [Sphingomonas sp. Root1294]KQY65342.1 2-oxoisovalerate dehydrogenase [Sphingomonas sp. Root50]KRB95364.1 2-oxoisovalerate dehydrogenase [Sphingomonas sp. Root720]
MTNRPTLQLYIPEPLARPGEAVDFGGLVIPSAGSVDRPATDTPESELRLLPYQLIRVLDDEGQAVGPWKPEATPLQLLCGLRAMMLTRAFDERLFRAHRQGKTSFYMKSTGEEALGAAPSMVLGYDDMCFPTYRVLSWLMARGYPLTDLVNQIFSNAKDPLKGRQLPILYSARDYGFYSLSGNVGSRFGHAVGWAMASAYKQDDKIALAYIGEGTTAEGDFHEALTFASVYRAPVILCVTNNQWAISSFAGIAGANETTFAAKALAYGIPGLRVDGNDFLAVWAATEWAAERARTNQGATLIEFFTYRASGHSTSDDPTKYRPADEPNHWPLGDPITRLKRHLINEGIWDDERDVHLLGEVDNEVKVAVREAESVGTLGKSKPPIAEMFEGVFAEPDWRLIEQRLEAGITP